KQDGFARYRQRFGDAWVETRTGKGDLQVRLKPLGEDRTLFERPGRFLLIQGEEITDTAGSARPAGVMSDRTAVPAWSFGETTTSVLSLARSSLWIHQR